MFWQFSQRVTVDAVETTGDTKRGAIISWAHRDVDVAVVLAVDLSSRHHDIWTGDVERLGFKRRDVIHLRGWKLLSALACRRRHRPSPKRQRRRNPTWRRRSRYRNVDRLEVGKLFADHLIPRGLAADYFPFRKVETVDEEHDMPSIFRVTGIKRQIGQDPLLCALGLSLCRAHPERWGTCPRRVCLTIGSGQIVDCAVSRVRTADLPHECLGFRMDKGTVFETGCRPIRHLIAPRSSEGRRVVSVGTGVDPRCTETWIVGRPEPVKRIDLVAVVKQLHLSGTVEIDDLHVEGSRTEILCRQVSGRSETCPNRHGVLRETVRGPTEVHQLLVVRVEEIESGIVGNTPGVGT